MCVTESALLISIECSSRFSFLWYSSFVINFTCFLKWLLRPIKFLLLRHFQSNYQIRLYKLNLLCEELSYQIINTLKKYFAKVSKNHYKKQNISKQLRDDFFWIYLRETWLNLFGLLLVALSFSTFIFSLCIKLFIRYSASWFY